MDVDWAACAAVLRSRSSFDGPARLCKAVGRFMPRPGVDPLMERSGDLAIRPGEVALKHPWRCLSLPASDAPELIHCVLSLFGVVGSVEHMRFTDGAAPTRPEYAGTELWIKHREASIDLRFRDRALAAYPGYLDPIDCSASRFEGVFECPTCSADTLDPRVVSGPYGRGGYAVCGACGCASRIALVPRSPADSDA